MAIRMEPVDAVMVGVGWTAAILAKELTDAGLSVVGLERGRVRQTVPDFQSPRIHDELTYAVRHELMQDVSRQTLTFRNSPDQTALPMRQLGSFLPGTDLGGAGVHWNGQTWRFLPWDFNTRSWSVERYGPQILGEDLTVQDWPVDYEDLEPYYDRFEKVCGISGTAGNLRGEIREGGNPFEGPRADGYPNPPLKQAYAGAIFGKAAAELGHHPFPVPAANMSRHYTNPYGLQLKPCMYCGYCERFACEHFAKSSPQVCVLPAIRDDGRFELRPRSEVVRVETTPDGTRATGVTYVDARGREVFQPAEMVFLTAFSFHNVRLLLLSGIGAPYDPATGEGVVGKNYTYQTMTSASAFFEDDVRLNQFMGAGALGTAIDDFNGDNFDHSGLGFVGGAYIAAYTTGARPILYHPVPPDTPRWGSAWKRAVARHYNHTMGITCHGSSMASRNNHLSLDPTYRDRHGQPLLRMTFDFPENDRRMAAFVTARAEEIARATGAPRVVANGLDEHYSIVPYQTTHNTGGAIMGDSPADSVVNRYCQSWDVPNLFVTGACLFPQNPGYNPTDTVGALAYWLADAVRGRYLPSPGPMVQA
jgi:gluconate 2-dehydrogenase alpha chain